MNVKARISFTGAVSMNQGEERDMQEGSAVLNDLMGAGYVVGVDLARGGDHTAYASMPTHDVTSTPPEGAAPQAEASAEKQMAADVGGYEILAKNSLEQDHKKTEELKRRNKAGKTVEQDENKRGDAGDSGAVCENG